MMKENKVESFLIDSKEAFKESVIKTAINLGFNQEEIFKGNLINGKVVYKIVFHCYEREYNRLR